MTWATNARPPRVSQPQDGAPEPDPGDGDKTNNVNKIRGMTWEEAELWAAELASDDHQNAAVPAAPVATNPTTPEQQAEPGNEEHNEPLDPEPPWRKSRRHLTPPPKEWQGAAPKVEAAARRDDNVQ